MTLARLYAYATRMRSVLTDLVRSLPRCSFCDRPATRAWRRGEARFCDTHGGPDAPAGPVPDYPRASALRNAQKLLRDPFWEQDP